MESLRVALALIRVPRLFLFLFLWPFLLGLVVAGFQVLFTTTFYEKVNQSTPDTKQEIVTRAKENELRWLLHGDKALLAEIQVCKWVKRNGDEFPPSDSCGFVSPLDVVLRLDDPSDKTIRSFARIFNGHTRQLHICEKCSSNIVITKTTSAGTKTEITSPWAFLVYALSRSPDEESIAHVLKAFEHRELVEDLQGTVLLRLQGIKDPIEIEATKKAMPLVLNAVCMIMIAVWLALRSHRRVLQYFASNDVLLPLVAAFRRGVFYRALWILTTLRVSCFLIAAAPLAYYVLKNTSIEATRVKLFSEPIAALLWLIAVSASLIVVTLISSIAELKERHSSLSVLYRYVPILCCLLGAGIWTASVVYGVGVGALVQHVLASLPVFGVVAVMLGPLLNMNLNVIAAHAILSVALACLLLRLNAQWFSGHLEEL